MWPQRTHIRPEHRPMQKPKTIFQFEFQFLGLELEKAPVEHASEVPSTTT